jgi:hypothetical protein
MSLPDADTDPTTWPERSTTLRLTVCTAGAPLTTTSGETASADVAGAVVDDAGRIASSDKKGGDQGIDGRLYFHDGGPPGDTKQIIFSVKAGRTMVPTYVDALVGVMEKMGAQMGVLLSFTPPTAGMRAVAASAGFFTSPWGSSHPRVQLLTVGQLLEGKQIDYPHLTGGNVTHRRAQRAQPTPDQAALDL